MVLIEARILRGNDCVLQIGRDLVERNECVAFAIGCVVNPGLHAALDVYRGCRWVDPPGGHKEQRGKRPQKQDADDKPSDKSSKGRSQKAPGTRRGCVGVRPFHHI
jgi:hypothetical protein